MAITKRLTCKFDMKIVVTSEDVESYVLNMVELTKGYVSGEKLDGMARKLVETAVEQGVEAAIELHLKSVLASKLKDELQGVYNISTRFKQ
uniref:HNS binding protein n=1 Tax=Escherichia phage Baskent_phicoli_1 TaxID=3145031 RepID=A0AAU8BAP5_9CAUD